MRGPVELCVICAPAFPGHRLTDLNAQLRSPSRITAGHPQVLRQNTLKQIAPLLALGSSATS
jgi:hypothetical protein